MSIPILNRLTFRDYQALVAASFFLLLEGLLRIVVTLLPQFVIQMFENVLRSLFPWLYRTGPSGKTKKLEVIEDFVDMVKKWGYPVENHVVTTRDDYILGLFRIPGGKNENADQRAENGKRPGKPVVLLMHGFMMNSEVWVACTEEKQNLPFILADAGYDVWLGNLRGNKYSLKHLQRKPHSRPFWEFSLDEFALYDLPDTIDHILKITGAPSCSYVGFSQGTAMAFAALSINPLLNKQINLFVALAPATTPHGLENAWIDAVVKATPAVIYLLFGRKSALSAALFWQRVLPPPLFAYLIDMSCNFLFGWTGRNMTPAQKNVAYQHLYSFTSVRSIVHWFQILRTGRFQMYDEMPSRLPYYSTADGHSPHRFPTQQIQTPIAIFYGTADSLVDIDVLLRDLPPPVKVKKMPMWEHLDFLWADGVEKMHLEVLELIKAYGTTENGEGMNTNVSKGKLLDAQKESRLEDSE
ncbi:uncharacterized protein VTP21DRAFT_1633 [Calcarisporiella thermophila]|uniref:uncharacterized protein n=1 Tax=Calcarisporiella thermophila TaxID=911321 RepID=UPI0037440400